MPANPKPFNHTARAHLQAAEGLLVVLRLQAVRRQEEVAHPVSRQRHLRQVLLVCQQVLQRLRFRFNVRSWQFNGKSQRQSKQIRIIPEIGSTRRSLWNTPGHAPAMRPSCRGRRAENQTAPSPHFAFVPCRQQPCVNQP